MYKVFIKESHRRAQPLCCTPKACSRAAAAMLPLAAAATLPTTGVAAAARLAFAAAARLAFAAAAAAAAACFADAAAAAGVAGLAVPPRGRRLVSAAATAGPAVPALSGWRVVAAATTARLPLWAARPLCRTPPMRSCIWLTFSRVQECALSCNVARPATPARTCAHGRALPVEEAICMHQLCDWVATGSQQGSNHAGGHANC